MASHLRPPDLEMQVRTQSEHGRTRLVFTLHSPTGAVGLSHHVIAGPFFQGSPEEFHRHLLHKIDQLGDLLDTDGSPLLPRGADRKLVSFGRALWRDLIPPELRSVYREIRETVRSWMITSDEPWIPWELVKPYEASGSGEILDDDFLALRFQVTRWLAGASTPAREITIRSIAALQTAELPQAGEEKRLLEDLVRSSPGVAGKGPSFDSAGELLSYLEASGVQLLHFMGHGSHSATHADESGIPFPDGSVFRPLDLEGPLATRIRRNQPLVFLNTCWAGQQGWSLTRLGGWAFHWIHVCGCSAFVAPLWPVRNQIALSFARAFYGALASGAPLGEAALEARRQIYQERPGDPSVLAYAIYGHPHSQVRFGTEPSEEEPLGLLETRKGRPIEWTPRRRWRPWWTWAAAALIAAGLLQLSADPLFDRFFPMDVSPQSRSLLEIQKQSKPPSKPEPAHSTRAATKEVKVGGLRFAISGGQSNVNSALKRALEQAAKPLVEQGISGWTIKLRLDRPSMTSHDEAGIPLMACRLTAEASAEKLGSSIDLGPVDNVNSQPDGSLACEAATERLAETVVSHFIQSLGRKGEQ